MNSAMNLRELQPGSEILHVSCNSCRSLDDLDAAVEMHATARALLAADRVREAEPLARAALERLCVVVGAEHLDVGEAAATLTEVCLRRGRITEAVKLIDLAAGACAAWQGAPEAEPLRLRILLATAEAMTRHGHDAEARGVLEELREELADDDPLRRAADLALGGLLRRQSRWSEAEALYRGMLAGLGDADPDRAVLLHDIAALACARGQYLAAAIWARQGLACQADVQSRRYALGLVGLADAVVGQGDAAGAADLYARALALLVRNDADDPEITVVSFRLGVVRSTLPPRAGA